MLGIGDCNLDPCRCQALLVLQNGAQLGRIVLNIFVERDFDIKLSSLVVCDRDGNGAWYVRVARRGKHLACSIDAIGAIGVDGGHAGGWKVVVAIAVALAMEQGRGKGARWGVREDNEKVVV